MDDQRYKRQEILASVGVQGQQKLKRSRVLVVGAGGLGCPALLYLAGAGVGTIGICDGDTVDITNLHRQVLFTEESLGQNKAREAARRLARRNSGIRYEVSEQFISPIGHGFILREWDAVMDATDRIESRYLLDDLCRLLNIPLIHASVNGDEIQVAVFGTDPIRPMDRICYRHLYPTPPLPDEVSTCANSGILGTVPGIAALIQARECLNLLLGNQTELLGKVLWMDTARYQQRVLGIASGSIPPTGGWPDSIEAVESYDYPAFCHSRSTFESTDESWIGALTSGAMLVDIRENHEQPRLAGWPHISIPEQNISDSLDLLEPHESMVIFCQSGFRGHRVVQLLQQRWPDKQVINIPGGIQTLADYISSIKPV